jgi:hypothetical protein
MALQKMQESVILSRVVMAELASLSLHTQGLFPTSNLTLDTGIVARF